MLIIQYDVNLEYNMTVPKPVPLHCYPIFLTMPGITLDKIKGFCLRKPKVVNIMVELVELACEHSLILKTVTFLLVGVCNSRLPMLELFETGSILEVILIPLFTMQ